jgi:hypothetical protein
MGRWVTAVGAPYTLWGVSNKENTELIPRKIFQHNDMPEVCTTFPLVWPDSC